MNRFPVHPALCSLVATPLIVERLLARSVRICTKGDNLALPRLPFFRSKPSGFTHTQLESTVSLLCTLLEVIQTMALGSTPWYDMQGPPPLCAPFPLPYLHPHPCTVLVYCNVLHQDTNLSCMHSPSSSRTPTSPPSPGSLSTQSATTTYHLSLASDYCPLYVRLFRQPHTLTHSANPTNPIDVGLLYHTFGQGEAESPSWQLFLESPSSRAPAIACLPACLPEIPLKSK